jgi:hypothetical protein
VNEGGEVGDPLAIPLAANLAPRTDLTLSGSYAGEVTENVRLTAIPGPMLGEEGVVVEEFIYDGAVDGDTWTMELSGAPPSDHFEALDGIGYGALEVPVTYQDEGSGDFGPGDQPLYAACSGDQAVILIWVDGPETLSEAMTFGVFGFSVGWSAMLSTEGGGPEAVPLDSLGDLVIDGSCSL